MGGQGGLREVERDLRAGKAAGFGESDEDTEETEINIIQPAHWGFLY